MQRATIHVDPDLCMASEICVVSFPAVMEIDERAQVAVPRDEAGGLSPGDLEELVSLCPTGAIHVRSV